MNIRNNTYKIINLSKKFLPTGDDWILKLFLIIMIVIFANNVRNAYTKGINDQQTIITEQKALDEYIALNNQITDELNYVSSIDYQKIFARDTQNLVEPGESLYQIIREEPLDIEDYTGEKKIIDYTDNFLWWKKLILE
jgi:cell division protein FtsB